MPANAFVSSVMFGCVHAPVAAVGAARNASTSATAPAFPSAATVCFGAAAPSIDHPDRDRGQRLRARHRAPTRRSPRTAPRSPPSAPGRRQVRQVRKLLRERRGVLRERRCRRRERVELEQERCRRRRQARDDRRDPVRLRRPARSSDARFATTSGAAPVSSSVDGFTALNAPGPTRTIGGASIANVWPFQSVAVMCTG